MNAVEKIQREYMKKEVPSFAVGDTVRVDVIITEGGKERVQAYTGVVIAHNGGGISESVTVRRVAFGQGVERVFPVHSPRVANIEVIRAGKVRRARLYYLRDQVGKAARVKEKRIQ